jgi:hypothetical protein
MFALRRPIATHAEIATDRPNASRSGGSGNGKAVGAGIDA